MEFIIPFIVAVIAIVVAVGLRHAPVHAGGFQGQDLLDPDRPPPRTSSDWLEELDWEWPER